jgi:hypothetical protein
MIERYNLKQRFGENNGTGNYFKRFENANRLSQYLNGRTRENVGMALEKQSDDFVQ